MKPAITIIYFISKLFQFPFYKFDKRPSSTRPQIILDCRHFSLLALFFYRPSVKKNIKHYHPIRPRSAYEIKHHHSVELLRKQLQRYSPKNLHNCGKRVRALYYSNTCQVPILFTSISIFRDFQLKRELLFHPGSIRHHSYTHLHLTPSSLLFTSNPGCICIQFPDTPPHTHSEPFTYFRFSLHNGAFRTLPRDFARFQCY